MNKSNTNYSYRIWMIGFSGYLICPFANGLVNEPDVDNSQYSIFSTVDDAFIFATKYIQKTGNKYTILPFFTL